MYNCQVTGFNDKADATTHAPRTSTDPMTGSHLADPTRVDASPDLIVTTASADETQRVGEALGRLLLPGDLVLLQGSLGSGKTTFTQGVARGMGLTSRVTSPSFTLANVYSPNGHGFPLNHLDLWRIKSAEEALGIGLEEYLSEDASCIIEWPDVAASVFPDEHVRIRFTANLDQRELSFRVDGTRGVAVVAALRDALQIQSVESGDARAPGN
jgi:tRNA threonylcarbamoyladenosine biosynthesis protein TsaE